MIQLSGEPALRTARVLFALARGAYVLTEQWLYASLEDSDWVDEMAYLHPRFLNQRQVPGGTLFKGLSFHLAERHNSSNRFVSSLITAAGGSIVKTIAAADIIVADVDWLRATLGKGGNFSMSSNKPPAIATKSEQIALLERMQSFDVISEVYINDCLENQAIIPRNALLKTIVTVPVAIPVNSGVVSLIITFTAYRMLTEYPRLYL